MPRERFATQVDTGIFSAIRTLAHQEGRQLQSLVDEALSDLIEKHRRIRPRLHVMGETLYGLIAALYEANDFTFEYLVALAAGECSARRCIIL